MSDTTSTEPITSPLPNIAQYCSHFLAPDMRHIYRQISGFTRINPIVLTQKRSHAKEFPFPKKQTIILPKSKLRALRRALYKQHLEQPWKIYPLETKQLLYTLQQENIKVLHIYFGNIALHLLPLIKITPIPTIVSFHGADAAVDMDKPHYHHALKQVFEAADLILSRSHSLSQQLIQLGCPEEKIQLSRTGIPFNNWQTKARLLPDPSQSDSCNYFPWQLLQSCRLVEKKGLYTNLQSFSKVHKHFPNSHLHIAGNGHLLIELQKVAASLNLTRHITFHGFLNEADLQSLLYRCHAFIHPSQTGNDGNQEGVPNAMLEAMATGIPAFATYHGGIPEAIEHGINGFLSNERDSDTLAQNIIQTLSNPELYQSLSKNAPKITWERFEQRNQIQHLEDHYFKLIQQHSS